MNKPDYSDSVYWENTILKYIENSNSFVADFYIEKQMWEYFKYSIKHKNRYFFQSSIMTLIQSELSKHTYTLKKDCYVYRARIDKNYALWNEWHEYKRLEREPQKIEYYRNRGFSSEIIEGLENNYENTLESSETKTMIERIESGFQGFNAQESGAPPPDKADIAGRCNPAGVSYLYVSQETDTAIAEIRPYIKDCISVAKLKPVRSLRLVDFYYNPDEMVRGEDFFFNDIQQEFSTIQKENSCDYFTTQYITSMIEYLGFDGLRFRSSLVKDGTNYVLFHPNDCEVISSNLYFLSEVKYKANKITK